jgi:hypothetical protein
MAGRLFKVLCKPLFGSLRHMAAKKEVRMSTAPIMLALVLLRSVNDVASDADRVNPSDFARRVLATADVVLAPE